MKALIFTLSLSTLLAAQPVLAANHSKIGTQVVTIETRDVTDQYPELDFEVSAQIENWTKAGAYLTAADVIVDKVINIGTKVWNVLEKGRAAYNFKNQQANALPEGALRWNQLQRWKSPVSKVYSVVGKNIFGVEIARFDYRVILLAGGDVEGIGRYIGYATVHPADVNVPFLGELDATVKVESVYNLGTKNNPVAGMVMNITLKSTSKIPFAPYLEVGQSITLDGNGNIRAM